MTAENPIDQDTHLQIQRLQALQALTDTALAHLSLGALLDELLMRIQDIMHVDNVAILLLDSTGQNLRIRAVRGVEEAVADQVRVPLGKGFAGTIAATKTPVVVDDLSTFPVVTTYLKEHLRSLLGVPLLVEDRVLGVVHVGTAFPTHFTEAEVSLLQRAADRIALAIDRARLYEEAERARAEAALHAQQLETIFETLVDGLVVFDGQGKLVRMNPAALALFGHERLPDYSLPQPQKEPATFHLRDEYKRPLTQEQWPINRILQGEALKGSSAVDVQVISQDGQEHDVSISGAPVRDQGGKIAGAVTVLHDVTERRRLARQTQEVLEAVLEMAEALVAGPGSADVPDVDSPREVQSVARKLATLICRVLGCQRVGISLLDVKTDLLRPLAVAGLSPEQEARWWSEQEQQQASLHASSEQAMIAQLEAGEVMQVDLTQPPYQNVPNPYGITTMLVIPLQLDGRLMGLLTLDHGGVVHHYSPEEQRLAQTVARLVALVVERERLLHERAEAEAKALALQEANQRLETFIGIVSHELRTPVTSLKANLQMALRRLRQGKEASAPSDRWDQARELLERMERQMRRLTRLLDDVIDLARIRSGKLEIEGQLCNLSALMLDIVRAEQASYPERTIQLQQIPDEEVLVMADPDRIGQVLTNYLTNALKYSPADTPVQVGLSREEGQARVWVRDQGPGIPPEEQMLIWEWFHRAAGVGVQSGSGVGLGLGLPISKSLIERHGGQVGVESEPGAGSTFWFVLPLAHQLTATE